MGSETSPFVRPVVRRIIERLFSEKDLWKSGELVDRVVQAYRDAGGSVVPNPNFTITRALNDLKSDGLVTSPGHGWWRWTRDSSEALPSRKRRQLRALRLMRESTTLSRRFGLRRKSEMGSNVYICTSILTIVD